MPKCLKASFPLHRAYIFHASSAIGQNLPKATQSHLWGGLFVKANQPRGQTTFQFSPFRAAIKPKSRCKTTHFAMRFGLFRNTLVYSALRSMVFYAENAVLKTATQARQPAAAYNAQTTMQ